MHGVLEEKVFIRQPPGYEDPKQPQYVYKLDKALYGLKQAPRAWYSWLSTKLYQLGFVSSKTDTSVFIFSRSEIVLYMLMYVDDIIKISSSEKATEILIQKLESEFAIKDLGNLSYFLGIETNFRKNGVTLTQQKYIMDLLQKTNMQSCKPITTPMVSSEKLSTE